MAIETNLPEYGRPSIAVQLVPPSLLRKIPKPAPLQYSVELPSTINDQSLEISTAIGSLLTLVQVSPPSGLLNT
jgi:hypothetical protein